MAAVVQKLREYGLAASAEQASAILVACQRRGAAKGRPLRDDEFLEIAEALGAQASES